MGFTGRRGQGTALGSGVTGPKGAQSCPELSSADVQLQPCLRDRDGDKDKVSCPLLPKCPQGPHVLLEFQKLRVLGAELGMRERKGWADFLLSSGLMVSSVREKGWEEANGAGKEEEDPQ